MRKFAITAVAVVTAVAMFGFAVPASAHEDGWNSVHDWQHDQLDQQHDDVHDQLGDEHAYAHEQGLNTWEHRQLHRQLQYQHEQSDYQIGRQHQREHRRDSWRRGYGNDGYDGGNSYYGY